ncbi:MAG: ribonuclease P protein component 1 [Candidatus Asgardarchaeia archaeon]
MKVTPYNLINHEFIGLKIKVSSHSNYHFNNLEGTVIFETKNLLFVKRDDGRIYKIPKKDGKFEFILPDNIVEVDGAIINSRPEERLKIKFRRKW